MGTNPAQWLVTLIMAKILFLEDDLQMASSVVDTLRFEKHTVDSVHNVRDAREFLKTYQYDLLILDWELHDGAGVEVCKQYKDSGGSAPVLMLTGKTEVRDRTTGLDSGADDYVLKPFDADELTARIRALLRRIANVEELISFGDIKLNLSTRNAYISDKQIQIRPREFALLEYLIKNADKLVAHSSLRNHVWWDEVEVERNTINAMVARVRKKIQEQGSKINITSVAGEGFKMEQNSG